ncbi:anti-restriction protein [Cellulophaga phage phi18:3]|uniref:Anti-restriction protein n=1 Tax=Cellulophaga phage phi18:3 TaxID=1327983 RepID=S0A274_9CAUD|nr:anti-restriction protein [Cellulophaga phage phi18:3]AGO48557.1 anti-restriction protein [Cellulophaga phage phi18:3]
MTTATTSTATKGRIFLTDYASYNNGTQFEFGHWVELDQFSDAEELNEYILNHFQECDEKSPLDSPREEIMITDFEDFPKAFYSESMDFEKLFEYFDRLDSCGFDADIVEAFAELGSYDINDIDTFFDALEESYSGKYNSDAEFAEDMAEQLCIEIPNTWPHNCIDWESAASDLMYDYLESYGHYFRSI